MSELQVQDVYAVLLARGYQEQLFSDLGERKPAKAGKEQTATCPFCGKERHFSYSTLKPVWRCWSCQEAGDWIRYLEKRRGFQFREALQLLARDAGLEIAGYDQARYQAYTRKADLLEVAQEYFIQQLQDPAGKPVLEYLLARGYTPEEIQAMELGAYVDRQGLQALLLQKGYTQQEIRDSGLLLQQKEHDPPQALGQTHTLALLWRDPAGRAIGLATRPATDELKGLSKYLYSAGLQKDQGLIGFSSVRGSPAIVVVEGVLDALYLNFRGFRSVGLGGTSISDSQARALEQTGTKELLLCLDADEAGQKGTARAIQELRRSRLRLYVVDELQGYKDPDELIRASGSQAFQDAYSLASSWPNWMAGYIVSKHDLQTARGRDMALDEALELLASIEDRIQQRDFLEALQASVGLTAEELASRLQEQKERSSEKRSQDVIQGLLRKVAELSSEGDVLGAELELTEGLQRLRSSRGVRAPEPYLLADLEQDVQTISAGLASGYSKLDCKAKIPQGALSIIAGRPGHGKTTFLLNLLINLARAYPERQFYFFSYEEAKSRLAVKCIMLMAGKVLSPAFNLEAYIGYLKEKRGTDRQIEKAIAEWEELAGAGRVWLQDSRLSAEDLATTIGWLARRGEVGAVLIDYIQKIGLQRPLQGQRYLELKAVSQLLLDQAVSWDIPIVLGAQLGRATGSDSKVRLDNLRESGDIEQDANLVLGLYNKSVEKAEEQDPEPGQAVPLQVSILKSRQGGAGQRITLSLERPVYRVKDESRDY